MTPNPSELDELIGLLSESACNAVFSENDSWSRSSDEMKLLAQNAIRMVLDSSLLFSAMRTNKMQEVEIPCCPHCRSVVLESHYINGEDENCFRCPCSSSPYWCASELGTKTVFVDKEEQPYDRESVETVSGNFEFPEPKDGDK